jgi:Golgi nucleoside diphosphatase
VACILQHVPFKERLTGYALVCRAWAAFAATVSGDVDASQLKSTEHCAQLQDWLYKSGVKVDALQTRPQRSTCGAVAQLVTAAAACPHVHAAAYRKFDLHEGTAVSARGQHAQQQQQANDRRLTH